MKDIEIKDKDNEAIKIIGYNEFEKIMNDIKFLPRGFKLSSFNRAIRSIAFPLKNDSNNHVSYIVSYNLNGKFIAQGSMNIINFDHKYLLNEHKENILKKVKETGSIYESEIKSEPYT